MRKYLLIILFVGISAVSFGQKVEVFDTINVATLQNFNAPSVGALVLSNILKFDFSAELLNENLSKIRDIRKHTQKPRKEDFAKYTTGGRGTTVWLVLHDMIENPGKYYIKVSIRASGELGALNKDVYYLVNCYIPRMAAPINLRKTYFFSESETFSFATVDYTDPNAYSYEVVDGSTAVLRGVGPVVKLDTILNDINNFGKQLTIKGLYQGKEFSYKNPQSGEVEKSTWQFAIEKPTLDEFNGWSSKDNDDWLISVYNSFSKQFLFVYLGMKPNGFVVVRPEARGLRVTSEPENFITGANQRKQGSFLYIDLLINEEFLNNMAVGSDEKVKITIQFTTQFGEKVKKEYYGVVIK